MALQRRCSGAEGALGVQHDSLLVALRRRAQIAPLRQVARELGLRPGPGSALISKVLAGKPISAESERMIGRALGVYPPARTVPRITPSKAQRERRDRLGVSWHEVIEKGLRSLEAQP